MFKTLQGVSINGGPPGVAFGGGIYGVSCDVATSNTPTKVTVNIVSENGTYAPPPLNVTSGGATSIAIGTSAGPPFVFYRMYPMKANYNRTASAKTLSITYVDHSVALDKIFLGLTGRHSTSALPASAQFGFTVECVDCNTIWPGKYQRTGSVNKMLWGTPAGGNINVSGLGGINGGYVILGLEQWTDNNCEVPKVEYSFAELCQTLNMLGYTHNLLSFNRSPTYTASYTGTFREVLNAWASDFSFSFYIDSTNPVLTIQGIDLTVGTSIAPVRAALAGGFGSGSAGGLIRSQNDSYSLENTYVQQPIVKNIKPARGFQRQQLSYRGGLGSGVIGKPVTILDAIGRSSHLGRSDDEMSISIALAKYKPEARIIWLSALAAAGGPAAPQWPALGFIPAPNGHIGNTTPATPGMTVNAVKKHVLSLFRTTSPVDGFAHPIWDDPDHYDVFIGVWNEAYQGAMESFDAELAEFWGKWGYWYGNKFDYVTMQQTGSVGICNPPPSLRQCPTFMDWTGQPHKYYDYSAKITTLPESKFYKENSYPFQDILRSSKGVFHLHGINPATGKPLGATLGGAGQPEGDALFPIDDNAWGTHPEHMDELFANRWVLDTSNTNAWDPDLAPQSDLEHFVPIYARWDADLTMITELRQILPNFTLDFMKTSERQEGYFPGVAIIPKMQHMIIKDPTTGVTGKVLEIGALYTANNEIAYQNTRRRRLEMAGTNTKDCTLFCEEDIVSEICECPPIQDPLHKFSSYSAPAFDISHLNNTKTIKFPIMSDYIGYWKSDVAFKGTYPKMIDIMGAPANPVGNVMETRVIDVDATQDIDPLEVGNGFVQQFAVNGFGGAPITLATYYGLIASMNQSATFEGETINVKIDGTEFDTLVGGAVNYLSAAAGLTSFNITMDGEGLTSDLTFSNRPPKMPKRDILMQKVGPRAIQGRYARPMARPGPQGAPSMPFAP
jgi:hypothetical protein